MLSRKSGYAYLIGENDAASDQLLFEEYRVSTVSSSSQSDRQEIRGDRWVQMES